MPCTSRLRPRPRSWCFGSARFVLSVAAIVQSGLHMTADAFAQPCPRCARVEGPAETWSAYGSQLPAGGAQPHFQQEASTGGATAAAVGGRWGWRRHRGGRGSSSAALSSVGTSAVGAVVAAGGAAVAVEERIGTQERSAISRGMTSVTTLTAIGTRPVVESMTVAEEALLVEDVKALAAYLKMRSNLAIVLGREPSREEWAASVGISTEALAVQMKASQHAQERIVESNIGLIVLMARRHHPGALSQGTITNDVIQEGSLALLRAAETFDPGLGFRFSTYAGWWVRDRVQRCVVEQARLIRLPQHVHNFRRTSAKTKNLLLKELGRAPTYAEIAERMEVDVARVIRYSNCPSTFSLDDAPSPSGGNGGGGGGGGGGRGIGARGKIAGAGYRHEKVACSMINPEQQAEAILFEGKLDKLMSVLSPDERLVVSLRYGLGGTSPTTLNEVAERAGSTRHRVRMMETRALNKLRRRPGRHRRGTARGAGGRGGRGGGGGRGSGGGGGRGGRGGALTVEVA